MSVLETFEQRRTEIVNGLVQGYAMRVAENRGKVEEVRKAAEAENQPDKAGVGIFQARKAVADSVREATERADDLLGLASFGWDGVSRRVEWQAERIIKAENPELYAEYRGALNRPAPESVFAEYEEAVHEIVGDLVRDFQNRIVLREMDLADIDKSIFLHLVENPDSHELSEQATRERANRYIEMELEKVALEKEITQMEIAIKYGADSDVMWLKANDFIREADPDLHELYKPIHQQLDRSEYCLEGIDLHDYHAVRAVYDDIWNEMLNSVMCGVEVQRCSVIYGIQEARLQLQYLENNKEQLIAITNFQQTEAVGLQDGSDSPWDAEVKRLEERIGFFERRKPILDEMMEHGRDSIQVYNDVSEGMAIHFEWLVEKHTNLLNDKARAITDEKLATQAAVDVYFKAFDNHVISMEVKLAQQRQQEQPGESENERVNTSLSNDSSLNNDVNMDIEALEALCKDETLYAAAHETALRSLTDEQVAIFEQASPTYVYDRLVANYANRFRLEKYAENDFMHQAHRYAIGDKSRLSREGGSPSALRIAEADVDFAAYKVDVFRRYVGNDNLLNADCRNEAHAIMPTCHPDITEKAIEAERAVHRGLSGDEAVEAYHALQDKYMKDHTGYDSCEWRLAFDEVVGAHLALRKHELHEPTLFDNLITGGKAKGQWLSAGKQYHDAFVAATEEFRDIDSVRHSIGGVAWEKLAREETECNIRSVYPELHEKALDRLEEVWLQSNSQRLVDEAERFAEDREQSGSHDLSR